MPRHRINRSKSRLNKDQQDKLKHKKKQDSEPLKQKESSKEIRKSWFRKLWQRKPINVSFEFSEDDKQFSKKIPHAKDFYEKPDWLTVYRQSGSVYIFELCPYTQSESTQSERKPGIITFYDKKGNTICIVNVSDKAQVTAKNADISSTDKNITDDVKDKKVEEKIDTEKESIPSDVDKIEDKPFTLFMTCEGKAGKQTPPIFPDIITRWENKPDWIKIDKILRNERRYSFEALSLNNKPEITIKGYNNKKQLVAIVIIIPDKGGKKEQISQEDSTSVLKNDGDKIVIVLKRDNNYTEKIRVISAVKPVLENKSLVINGDINPSDIDGEWTVSLSIEKSYQKNMLDKRLKIIVKYTIKDEIPYVICKLPDDDEDILTLQDGIPYVQCKLRTEQSLENKPQKPINITLELNTQFVEFQVNEDRKIKLEMTKDGQLKTDQKDNPQKITVPNSDNLGAKLTNNLCTVLSNPGIDVNEQDKKEMRGLLADLIANPDDTKALIKLLGLKNKEKPPQDPSQGKKEEPVIPPIQEKPTEEIRFNNNKIAKVLSELRNEVKKASYDESVSDDEMLRKIEDNLSSDDFSLDDPSLRSLIYWSFILYKRRDKSNDIWDKFVEKMRDLDIFVIYKEGSQYNEIDYVSTEGPVRDAFVAEVIQPGFKTSAGYGGVPRIIEPAIVITSSRV